mgnify:CR=1 FL=1
MQQYMAEITLPSKATTDYIELIPLQRSFVERMFKRGIITSYALAVDRSKIWVTFFTATVEEAEAVIRKFPIADYISYDIRELAFRNSISTLMPAMSLN